MAFVEPYEVRTGPPLKPVKVPLNDIPALQCVVRTTQLGVIGKLVKIHSISLSMSLTKIFKSISPSTDP